MQLEERLSHYLSWVLDMLDRELTEENLVCVKSQDVHPLCPFFSSSVLGLSIFVVACTRRHLRIVRIPFGWRGFPLSPHMVRSFLAANQRIFEVRQQTRGIGINDFIAVAQICRLGFRFASGRFGPIPDSQSQTNPLYTHPHIQAALQDMLKDYKKAYRSRWSVERNVAFVCFFLCVWWRWRF